MRRIGMTVLGLTLVAAPLAGQRSALREVRDRGSAGLTFAVAEPRGVFSRTGDVAVGLAGFAVVGGGGGLELRVDGTYMMYDSDYRGYGISTTSSIGSLGVGPQLTLGRGPIRPYGFATLGGSAFWTSVSDAGYCGCYDRDTFFLDGHVTTVTQAGAGLLITVSRRRASVAIDLSVRDVRHSTVKYVPADGITDHGGGNFTVESVETPVRQRVYQVGVSIGLR